jgi:hypothetical protein
MMQRRHRNNCIERLVTEVSREQVAVQNRHVFAVGAREQALALPQAIRGGWSAGAGGGEDSDNRLLLHFRVSAS